MARDENTATGPARLVLLMAGILFWAVGGSLSEGGLNRAIILFRFYLRSGEKDHAHTRQDFFITGASDCVKWHPPG